MPLPQVFSPLLVFISVKLKRATTVTRRCWCFFTNNINLQSVPSSDAAAVDSAGVETPTGEKYLLFELSERNA